MSTIVTGARTGRSRMRWWEWAPEVVLALGLGFFFFDEMDAATSAFASPRAITLMVVAAAGWLGLRLLMGRFVPSAAFRVAVLSVLAIGIMAIVVVPAYRNHTVVEELPVVRADAVLTPPAAEVAPSQMPAEAAPAPAPVTGPMRIRSGSFRGIDHRARGSVNIYVRDDGSQFVGLEEFDIQPGPDYDVFVVPGADRTDPEGGVRLDDLRGNAGSQFYEVPAGSDVTDGAWTVLIWCQTFDVPVANATPV